MLFDMSKQQQHQTKKQKLQRNQPAEEEQHEQIEQMEKLDKADKVTDSGEAGEDIKLSVTTDASDRDDEPNRGRLVKQAERRKLPKKLQKPNQHNKRDGVDRPNDSDEYVGSHATDESEDSIEVKHRKHAKQSNKPDKVVDDDEDGNDGDVSDDDDGEDDDDARNDGDDGADPNVEDGNNESKQIERRKQVDEMGDNSETDDSQMAEQTELSGQRPVLPNKGKQVAEHAEQEEQPYPPQLRESLQIRRYTLESYKHRNNPSHVREEIDVHPIMKEYFQPELDVLKDFLRNKDYALILASWITHIKKSVATEEKARMFQQLMLNQNNPTLAISSLDLIPADHNSEDTLANRTNPENVVGMIRSSANAVRSTPLDRNRVQQLLDFLTTAEITQPMHVNITTRHRDFLEESVSQVASLICHTGQDIHERIPFEQRIASAKNINAKNVVPFSLLNESQVVFSDDYTFLKHFTLLTIAGIYWHGLQTIGGKDIFNDVLPIEFENKRKRQSEFKTKSSRKKQLISTICDENMDTYFKIRKTSSFIDNLPSSTHEYILRWIHDKLSHFDILNTLQSYHYNTDINFFVHTANNYVLVTMLAKFISTNFLLLPIPPQSYTPSADLIFDMAESIYNAGQLFNNRQSRVTDDHFFCQQLVDHATKISSGPCFKIIIEKFPLVEIFINKYLEFFRTFNHI